MLLTARGPQLLLAFVACGYGWTCNWLHPPLFQATVTAAD